jgi:hypothetical protein
MADPREFVEEDGVVMRGPGRRAVGEGVGRGAPRPRPPGLIRRRTAVRIGVAEDEHVREHAGGVTDRVRSAVP